MVWVKKNSVKDGTRFSEPDFILVDFVAIFWFTSQLVSKFYLADVIFLQGASATLRWVYIIYSLGCFLTFLCCSWEVNHCGL